jgi:hypothetical protein
MSLEIKGYLLKLLREFSLKLNSAFDAVIFGITLHLCLKLIWNMNLLHIVNENFFIHFLENRSNRVLLGFITVPIDVIRFG